MKVYIPIVVTFPDKKPDVVRAYGVWSDDIAAEQAIAQHEPKVPFTAQVLELELDELKEVVISD